MKEGLIFANARAKELEKNLFSEDRLARLAECADIADAVKILYESGYAGGMVLDDPADFEKLLLEEQRIAAEFARSVTPKGIGLECFFAKNDYHNFKALLKAKYSGIADPSAMIMPSGNVPPAEIKKAAEGENSDAPVYMTEAAKEIKKKFENGGGTPRFIDITADKAMFADINAMLENRGSSPAVKRYFTALTDLTNISSAVRTFNIGGGAAFLAEQFIEGGEISLKRLTDCLSDPGSKLHAELKSTPYDKIAQDALSSYPAGYETAQDNFLLKIFSGERHDMFSAAPVIGYYLAKLNEIKVIRVVLVCIKNKVSKQDMKKRVRTLYAQ